MLQLLVQPIHIIINITDFNTPAVSIGNNPILVYPDVILLSARSNTELVTSDIYARVGLGLLYIDYNICVAVMTNLPAFITLFDINFCKSITFSIGTYIPRSPLATIIPSDAYIS